MTFLTDLQNRLPDLPKQERKIALFILQDPQFIQSANINQLASTIKVSNATITRFARRVNCSSFTDLKVKLAAAAASSQANTITNQDNSKTTAHQVYDFYNRVLSETQNKLDIKQLKKIIQLISSAKRVYFYGIGSSGYTSLEATQRLLRMGISAFAETESNNMFMTSSIISKNDLIIAISSTGSTDSLVRAIELAKKNKATVVALTSYDNSPLAQLADIVVGVQDTNYINDARFINSQFSIMYVIDVITTLLLKNKKYHDRMTRTITSVLNEKYDAYNK